MRRTNLLVFIASVCTSSLLLSSCGSLTVKPEQFAFKSPSVDPNQPVEELVHYVDVRNLDLNIFPINKAHRSKVLSDGFMCNPHEEFFSCLSSSDWPAMWPMFTSELLEKAKAQELDTESLMKCLEALKPDNWYPYAIVPIGAYSARCGFTKIWIIPCKWERIGIPNKNEKVLATYLGHIAVYCYRAKDQKEIGQCSCM